MRRTSLRIATLAAACVLAVPATLHAQPADVPALTKLIEQQPGNMDRSTWKEQRREAARKLWHSKDRRAVPVLIKLAETESFDIIGDIAIEGLGMLGDQAAVPVLQKIANDQTRDKATRELARKALARLGASAAGSGATAAPTRPSGAPDTGSAGGGEPTGPDTTGSGSSTSGTTPAEPSSDLGVGGTSSTLLGEPRAAAPSADVPELPEDALAAYDRLTFAAGTATLAYDTVRKRPSFDADVAGRYETRIEREAIAWGWDLGAHVVAGLINPDGRAQTRGTQMTVDGGGEARFYSGKLYGVGKAAAGFQHNYLSYVDDDDPDQDLKDTRLYADVQVALGGGYGRVLDVGGAIRVRRLSRALDAARALGRAIDPATAKRLQLAWWSLRGERSTYPALVATVSILREAGILLGEPDAGLSYEILAVLRDTQLFLRPSGLDVQLAIGEGYLHRSDMDPTVNERGRVEQLLASAAYGQQLADDKLELSGSAFGRLRLFAPDDQPSPWAVGATARLRRFAYGSHGDPLGALDLAATVLLASDSCVGMDCDSTTALRIQGELGFTLWMNQASGVRLAATAAEDGGELFVGANLTATYGLLDATFAGL